MHHQIFRHQGVHVLKKVRKDLSSSTILCFELDYSTISSIKLNHNNLVWVYGDSFLMNQRVFLCLNHISKFWTSYSSYSLQITIPWLEFSNGSNCSLFSSSTILYTSSTSVPRKQSAQPSRLTDYHKIIFIVRKIRPIHSMNLLVHFPTITFISEI